MTWIKLKEYRRGSCSPARQLLATEFSSPAAQDPRAAEATTGDGEIRRSLPCINDKRLLRRT
ncbi:MAG: hypothetical protein C0478_16810 [Planctomyces sp.]|nr:hypothetical protein [Planctomyces sp.]